MNRHAITYAHLLILISSTSAVSETAHWDRAWSFREQIGLAPMDIAAMGLGAEAQEALSAMVRNRFSAEADTNGPPVDAVGEAGAEVSHRLSWGRDATDAWTDLEAARTELIEALAPLIDDSEARLPENLRRYVNRAIANLGLDSPYRLLELTDAQWQAMLRLHERRDQVLRDARQWHRPARLETAREAFATQVERILTPAQRTELAQFQANIAANLDAVWDRELADYPTPEAEGEQAKRSFRGAMQDLIARARQASRHLAAMLTAGGPPVLAATGGSPPTEAKAPKALRPAMTPEAQDPKVLAAPREQNEQR